MTDVENPAASLDPAAADERVVPADAVPADPVPAAPESAVQPAAVAAPGRLARGARATGRGAIKLLLFVLGAGLGFGAGWGYGPGLVAGKSGTDLLPSYAVWPWFWWALVATVPVALVVAFSRRARPAAFGYVLALPWQLVLSLGYTLVTFGEWGFAPLS